MKNNNTQYKNKYIKTFYSRQKERKNNDNDAYSQRLQSVTKPRSWLLFAVKKKRRCISNLIFSKAVINCLMQKF